MILNPGCTDCKLHKNADKVCVPGSGPKDAEIVVISKNPSGRRYMEGLTADLEEAGINPGNVYFTSAVKCRNWEDEVSNADVKQCRKYLEEELRLIKPKYILALGNEGLLSSTGHSGITKYRGQVLDKPFGTVIPTISPAAVSRNPGQRQGYIADLIFFSNKARGISTEVHVPKYTILDTKAKLKKAYEIFDKTVLISFDIETNINPQGEFDPKARMISLAGSCLVQRNGKLSFFGFALPLFHPESPWKNTWRSVLRYFAPVLSKIPKGIAHNGKFDSRWLRRFGVDLVCTFDTMLAIHLLNENIVKALKPNGQFRLGVAPWGMDTKELLKDPLEKVLEYNFLDTYYTYLIYKQLKEELKQQPRLAKIMMKLLMPASKELVPAEARGMWIDVERLYDRHPKAIAELERIEAQISSYLPDPDSEEWPKNSKGKPLEINYNASNFARWFLFQYLGLPITARGKNKPDGSPGDPSMAEDVINHLKDEHPVVALMLERVKWQKYNSGFFNPYKTLYDDEHRMHTSFKLFGTVTGRLSSGKEDQSKLSASRRKASGFNAQQVPRDPFIRGMIGAPPGWIFVEADYSQIELRIAAFLADEKHMKHLYSVGADIHTITTAAVTGLPPSQIPKEVRKKIGKPVNFGFLYGMGWPKFIETAFNNYGSVFTAQEAKAYRDAYFKLYPDLLPWHNKQRRLVAKYGRVESPIGRIRHLPDIYSPEVGVRREAERQAINSPVQGFASDMAVLSMVRISQKFKELDLPAHFIGLVHDAVNFEVREDALAQVLPIIKETMEDMEPLRKDFGVVVDIPIIADLQIGRHWGDNIELSEDQVFDFPGLHILGEH